MTSSPVYRKPLPLPDADSAPFWDACRKHRLVAPQCPACGRWRWPPQGRCPRCHSPGVRWATLEGVGEVVSYVVCHQTPHPGFAAEVPFTVADVRLYGTGGAVVLSGNVVGCPWEDVHVGMRVQVGFDDVTPETTLFRFVPAPTGRPRGPGTPR